MPDFDAIATGLAGRFDPGVVTPPSGLAAIRYSTANLPNQLSPLPVVLVFPDSGDFATGNGTRLGTHKYFARFYYSMGLDISRDMVALRKWLTVLVDQLKAAAQLGGIVARAIVASYQIGKMTYAGDEFNGIELVVEITTAEPWAATA